MNQLEKKNKVAEAALQYIENGQIVGIGSGSTVNCFIDMLDKVKSKIEAVVSSSESTTKLVESKNIKVIELREAGKIPIYIDGADEANKFKQLIKGGGGALTNGIPLTVDGVTINNISSFGYWEIVPSNSDYTSSICNVNYTMTLHMNNILDIDDVSTSRIIKSSGSNVPGLNHVVWTGLPAVPPPVPKKLKPFVIDVIVKLSMVPVDETAGNPVQTT